MADPRAWGLSPEAGSMAGLPGVGCDLREHRAAAGEAHGGWDTGRKSPGLALPPAICCPRKPGRRGSTL
jgi:hypothetical protein